MKIHEMIIKSKFYSAMPNMKKALLDLLPV